MRHPLFLMVLLILSLSSCKVFHTSQENNNQAEEIKKAPQISDQNRLQYEFSYMEGVKQKFLGNFNSAMGYFYKCRELDNNAAAPLYELSQINTMISETKLAVKFGKEAVEKNPENKWYRKHLAQLYIQNSKFPPAIDQYEKIVELDQENLENFFTLAQLYQQTGAFEKALQQLNKIENRTGVNEQLSMMKQSIYIELGEKEKAVEEIKSLIQNYPSETRYYGMLAELYAKYQEFEKAEEMYNKLFSLDSTNNLGQISKIRFLEQSGKVAKALDLFITSINNEKIDYGTKLLIFMNFIEDRQTVRNHSDLLRNSLDSLSSFYPDKFQNHTLYADFYIKTNQYKKAIRELEYLVQSPEEKYLFWEQLISLYSFTEDYQGLYEKGLEALNKYDSKPRLYLLTAVGAQQVGKEDEAVNLLKDGLVYIKNDQQLLVNFYTQLAETYHRLEEYSKSDYYFEKVLNLQPGNVLVLNNYSYYLSLRGVKLDKALEMSQKTVEKEPRSAIYLDTYAWILYQQGKYEKAKDYIEKALKYGGNEDGDVVEHYGDVLYKLGETEEAIDQWKKARSLGNKSEELIRKIENKSLIGEN